MKINCDLHCHSGYAGGVGNISFGDIENAMPLKGIDIVSTGDCLQKEWMKTLRSTMTEVADGLFARSAEKLPPSLSQKTPFGSHSTERCDETPISENPVKYLLQTEVIFTSPVGKGRKSVHHVLLFPSFESVERCYDLMDRWGVKLKIGRPFIKCDGRDDVAGRLYDINRIDPLIESIPAHVMTPDGVYGSKNPISYMKDFYGEGVDLINAVETGLSADPIILGQIPELDDYTLISNSDAHSSQLHRMGREFTSFDVEKIDYPSIVRAIRNNRVLHTAEFDPTEGRYFLTGHRKDRKDHGKQYCVYSPKHSPRGNKCPICSKNLTVGVLERSQVLKEEQGGEDRYWGYRPANSPDFIHMVPLVEIIAYTLGVRSPTSKRVLQVYHEMMRWINSECEMWFMEKADIRRRLIGNIDDALIDNIIMIKDGAFSFSPMGFDGTYGRLRIGKTADIFEVKIEEFQGKQTTLSSY